jgi:hypothetical protein
MKQKLLPLMRSALPALGALALALVFTLSSIPANADTATSANLIECCGMICDPATCPQPCLDMCKAGKVSHHDMQEMCAKHMQTAAVTKTAAATGCESCPVPCAQKCSGSVKATAKL